MDHNDTEIEKYACIQRHGRAHTRETALVRRIVEGLSQRARFEVSSKLRWAHTAVADDAGATNETRAAAQQMEAFFAAVMRAQNLSFPRAEKVTEIESILDLSGVPAADLASRYGLTKTTSGPTPCAPHAPAASQGASNRLGRREHYFSARAIGREGGVFMRI
jgi:hypothetical protein